MILLVRALLRYFNSRTSCEVRRLAVSGFERGWQISTHAPLARCDPVRQFSLFRVSISTHAPLARCDMRRVTLACLRSVFQLTHLLRGATSAVCLLLINYVISTHAPLARCDGCGAGTSTTPPNFNSRTSCEVRLGRWVEKAAKAISTHAPLARCDEVRYFHRLIHRISTHAPLARCDLHLYRVEDGKKISTHAPLARCDRGRRQYQYAYLISTHAPLARCDQ